MLHSLRSGVLAATVALGLILEMGCGASGSHPNRIASITVQPASASIQVGQTQQFGGYATTNSGQKITGPGASWSSSDTSIATIDPSSGLATGVGVGKATISATVQTGGGPVTGTATLTVTAAPAPLTIAAVTFPQGTVGQSYTSTTLSASGGTTPYTWSISAGALPGGLTLSSAGVVSGTPTVAGTFNFTVQVQDSASNSTTADETIVIASSTTASCSGAGGGSEAFLKGQYSFLLTGLDANGNPNAAAGTLTLDGSGNVTAGEEDQNLNSASSESNLTILAASGAYSIGDDDRGCLAITTSAGTAVFRLAVANISSGVAQKAFLVEFDGNYASGTLKLQDTSAFTSAAFSGNYAFGFDSPAAGAFASVGSFAVSGGAVSGGELDINVAGNVNGTGSALPTSSPVTFTGTATVDSSGRATLAFSDSVRNINSVCYVVSAVELNCISSDPQSTSAAFAGRVLKQSSTPFSVSSLNGGYVRYQVGKASSATGTKAEIALVQCDGAGHFSQSAAANDGGTYNDTLSASGTYKVAASGRVKTGGPVFYLVSPQVAFAMSTDAILSFGYMEKQSSTSLTAGWYPFGQVLPSSLGTITQTGVASVDSAGNVSGDADVSLPGGTLYPLESLAGGTATISSTGFGTISWSGTVENAFYVVSPTKFVMIDTVGTGPELQVGEQ